jgi:transposase
VTRRRYELSDHEWSILSPLLPNKPRGIARVDDRRVLNGILWRKAGVWDRLLDAVLEAYDGDIVMIGSTCVRVHQHAATGKRGMVTMAAWDAPAAGSRAKSTRLSMQKAGPSTYA